jgi:Cu/Ag efflux pump CusA
VLAGPSGVPTRSRTRKSFALAGVAVLAITLVPALIRPSPRKLKSQEEVWLVRSFVNICTALLEFS